MESGQGPSPEERKKLWAERQASRAELEMKLLQNIRAEEANLKELLKETEAYDSEMTSDGFYRFYHGSFKVNRLQEWMARVRPKLEEIHPDLKLGFHEWFEQIYRAGNAEPFSLKHNEDWMKYAKPVLEAYLHTKHLVEMMVRYGPTRYAGQLPYSTGWALVMTLYSMG